MKTRKYALLLGWLIMLLLSAPFAAVQAQTPLSHGNVEQATTQPRLRAFSIHDTNRDGSLSREEYNYFVHQIKNRRTASGRPPQQYSPLFSFDSIDSNHDGSISEDEMITVLNQGLQKRRRHRHRGNW